MSKNMGKSGQQKGERTRPEIGILYGAFFCKNIGGPNQSLSGGYWRDFSDGTQKVTELFGKSEQSDRGR